MKPACLAFVFALSLSATFASAQTDTTFTYQGELQQNGSLANGAFDMNFSLWDTHAHGNQIGTTGQHNDVPVVDGQFKVKLDFGATAFDNSARWLKITVNGSPLSPRQPITRVPYAIQTRGIFVDENYNVGIGTSDPWGHLDVNGRVYATGLFFRHNDGPNSGIGTDDVNNLNVFTSPHGSIIFIDNGSLGRLMTIDPDGLRGVTFEYIDPDAIHELPGQRIGMIAQEVEKVVPDWVDVRGDGYKTVTPRGFEALTVEALRELREEKNNEIKSLRAEKDSQVSELKQQNVVAATASRYATTN